MARLKGRAARWVLALLLMAAGAAYLMGTGLQTGSYYLEVPEAVARAQELGGRLVRVNGTVLPGTLQFDAAAMRLSFVVGDAGFELPVEYQGMRPDALVEGGQVLAEGKLTADGRLEATTLMPRCPSKYEAESGTEKDLEKGLEQGA